MRSNPRKRWQRCAVTLTVIRCVCVMYLHVAERWRPSSLESERSAHTAKWDTRTEWIRGWDLRGCVKGSRWYVRTSLLWNADGGKNNKLIYNIWSVFPVCSAATNAFVGVCVNTCEYLAPLIEPPGANVMHHRLIRHRGDRDGPDCCKTFVQNQKGPKKICDIRCVASLDIICGAEFSSGCRT